MTRSTALLAALTLAIGSLGLADAGGQSFTHFGEQNGLAHNDITAMLRTGTGEMLIGTREGLQIWRGIDLNAADVLNAENSGLPDSYVSSLFAMTDSLILVGTERGGLAIFDMSSQLIDPVRVAPSCGSQEDLRREVSSIMPLPDGSYWISTSSGPVMRFVPEEGICTYQTSDPKLAGLRQLSVAIADGPDAVWTGGWNQGLYRIGFSGWEFELVDSLSLPNSRIRDFARAPDGSLWIATSGGGVWRYEPLTKALDRLKFILDPGVQLPVTRIWALEMDFPYLWIGTYDGGLSRYHLEKNTLETLLRNPNDPGSICDNAMIDLHSDGFGMIWVATENGLCGVATRFARHISPADLGTISSVSAASDSSSVWVGQSAGVSRIEVTEPEMIVESIPVSSNIRRDSFIRSVVELDSEIVVGSPAHGLMRSRRGILSLLPLEGRSLQPAVVALRVSRDRLFVSTMGTGVFELDPVTFRTRQVMDHQGHTRSTNALIVDAGGDLWAASIGGGLVRVPLSGGTVSAMPGWADSTRDRGFDSATDLTFDSDSLIWVSTRGGMASVSPSGTRPTYYRSWSGFSADELLGVEADSKTARIWTVADDALSYRDPQTAEWRTFRPFVNPETHPLIQYGLVVSSEGVLVATSDAVLLVPPLAEPPRSPSPTVTLASEQGTVASGTQEVGLPRGDTALSVAMALPDLYRPSKIRMQILLGDRPPVEWHGAQVTHTFPDLTPRSEPYRLSATIVASSGQVFKKHFLVTVRPTLWKTAWFQAVAGLSFILTLVGGIGARRRRQAREAIEIQTALAQGREKERAMLSRHIHDDPLQALYVVKHKLESVDPKGDPRELEKIGEIAGRTIDALRRICGELRPSTIGRVSLDRSIASKCAEFQRENAELHVEHRLEPVGELAENVVVAVYRILQGGLANVARHAGASNVFIELSQDSTHLRLLIRDDGIGVQTDTSMIALARGRHLGLLGMFEWASQIQGELKLQSEPEFGTTLVLSVPRTST